MRPVPPCFELSAAQISRNWIKLKSYPTRQGDKNLLGETCQQIFRSTPVFVLRQTQGSASHSLRKKDKNQVRAPYHDFALQLLLRKMLE